SADVCSLALVVANVRKNRCWSFAYISVLIRVAAGVLVSVGAPDLSPVLAAGAMPFSSVYVLGTALRLRRAG
ncbi:hypothetical protein, partial [Methylobacterium radiotolerans]|uniref:hypothetical protein n=1 Tax=Methylobacterium radiotolerans TaxID=31998 RepID=UPI000B91DCFA